MCRSPFFGPLAVAIILMSSLVFADRAHSGPSKKDVLKVYADIAFAGYDDSLISARVLKSAISELLKNPSKDSLEKARSAWRAARIPYQQTEVFRFGNTIVDDWEGRVNAWPLDEGLIDYVSDEYGTESDENDLYVANVIAARSIKIGGKTVDTSTIDKKLVSETLHEAGGIEANVASGYHAIEFLLWGQDLNGTGPGAGNRPATDFDLKKCTNGNCERRGDYLMAAVDLLIDDLEWMAGKWAEGGDARKQLLGGPADAGLVAMLTGMGSLSYGELAGERMKLGLLIHDPEEEHDCFSDNTHNSHYWDAAGIRNIYLGTYKRTDGSVVSGSSLSDLVKAADPKLDAETRAALDATLSAMEAMVKRAEGGEAYDQMIGEGNEQGNAVVQAAIDGLVKQTKSIERVIAVLKLRSISFEGSDSLDDPQKVNK